MADDRFMRKGVTKMHFVPTIATLAAATVAEVAAGVDITPQVAEVTGFSFENNPINTPNLDDAFVGQISGEDTVAASSCTMYDLSDNTTLKAALAKGTSGFMLIFYSGIAGSSPAASDDYEAWPVDISSNSRQYSAGNEAAQYVVSFAPNLAPVEGTVAA